MRFNPDDRRRQERPSRDRARELRQHATMPERMLWNLLRGGRFVVDGTPVRFRRQHPIGPYIADFYCPELGLVVELDGLAHVPTSDAGRDRYMRSLGLTVRRYPAAHFVRFKANVIQDIAQAVRELRAQPGDAKESERAPIP